MPSTAKTYPANYFLRVDNTDDARFYHSARKVVHIDDAAIADLTSVLAELLPPGGRYLDLMSSWRSHLPQALEPAEVVGLGMNAEEMADNPQLTSHVVHDLNLDPTLPFKNEYADGYFDAAICTVSVQYLTQPIEVFQSVNRVLKQNAPFILSFSNRCFPQKAVAIWQSLNDMQHAQLVGNYFTASATNAPDNIDAAAWSEARMWTNEAANSGFPSRDPLYVVWALKESA